MDLEVIEQKCLDYLHEVSNPLVPVGRLLQYLHRDSTCSGLAEYELLDFLRENHLFRVIDSIGLSVDPTEAARFAELGIETGPRVILATRIPARSEISSLILTQLDQMVDALIKALEEATAQQDAESCSHIEEILTRTQNLQTRFREAF